MKLSRTSWIVLGVGLFIIAVLGFYLVYQGQAGRRQEARDSLNQTQVLVSKLISDEQELESELGQLEEELAGWQNDIDQLKTELAWAEAALDKTKAAFPASVESIEYDEMLFGFARDAGLEIVSLTASEPAAVSEQDIVYSVTSFTVEVRGGVADILDFINAVTTDENFRTTVLKPVDVVVPRPLTGAEKEQVREEITTVLVQEERAKLTVREMETLTRGFREGITGAELEALIPDKIASMTDAEVEEFIEGEIAGLTGEEVEALIWEKIAGLTAAELRDFLKTEIDGLVSGMVDEYFEGLVSESVEELAAGRIAEMEQPSAVVDLIVYTYRGE